jgi:predicted TIM-barrel fold metal-dependent hydrolase
MASRTVDFPVFDADNHFYETREALTRYLPDKYSGAIDYVEVRGRTRIAVRGQITDYIPNPTFERVGRPGAQEEYFKHGNPDGKSAREIIGRGIDCPEAFRSAEPRLALMNEQGVHGAFIYPTLASLLEARITDDPELCGAAIHALNQWMAEEWPFRFHDRIYSTPVITPGIVDQAISELDWSVEHRAKAVLMRPSPAWGFRGPRSFALPEFDPFWAKVQDSGVVVVIHASDDGYERYFNEWEGVQGEALAFGQPKPFTQILTNDYRDIQDAVSSIIAHGLLTRFPRLKFVLVENGGGWVPGMLHRLDHTYEQMPQAFAELPSDTFKRSFWMHPFHEEDPRGLVALLGSGHVCFGSDFPHVEGLSDPLSYIDELDGLPDRDVARIMGGNLIDLLGVPVPG